MKENMDRWLKLDGQLKPNDQIKEAASKFEGTDRQKIRKISEWISEEFRYLRGEENLKNFDEEFMKRDVSEIFDSGYLRGCTDRSLVFVTLARLNNIPTKWVYLVDAQLILDNAVSHAGHGVTECYFDNDWHYVDPTQRWGLFWKSLPAWFDVYYKGNSPRDAGILNFEKLKEIIQKEGSVKCHFDLPKDIALPLLEKSNELDEPAADLIKKYIQEGLQKTEADCN